MTQPSRTDYAVRLAAVLFGAATSLAAGPVEFGRQELRAAADARGISAGISLREEIVPGRAESYRIESGKVVAGDERGLMYGLLDAAEQVRLTGRVVPAKGEPQVAMRGIRFFLHNRDLEEDWFFSRAYWDQYLAMLARNRFNRFNLVYAHQTNYLTPPYPFLVEVPEFPAVRVRGLTPDQRDRHLAMLGYISQAAAEHGIDFTLGIWQQTPFHDWPLVSAENKSVVEGITPENSGQYTYAALKKILNACPGIRSVQLRTNDEAGLPAGKAAEFFRDWVFRAIREADHPVSLDVRAWVMPPGLEEELKHSGIPYRLSTKYWAEYIGRAYHPAETFPRYSYGSLLKKAPDGRRPYDIYYELWGLGSNRLLLWGDPEFVRRTVPTLGLGGAIGFEIDPPLAQKGFGNWSGKWDIFTEAQAARKFWRYEFERYWLFYQLWGRLSYDPLVSDDIWRAEAGNRFGRAGPDVLAAYQSASGIINELVAAHMPNPNMGYWPEINPGGLLDEYCEVLPSDQRFIASIREAVRLRREGIASAKQSPYETAALLDRLAADTEAAVLRVNRVVDDRHAEWKSSEPDFRVLATLGRYHALKMKAAYDVAWFDATGEVDALAAARRGLESALGKWEELVKSTDGIYPNEMSFGPRDAGHWKDKLPYVRHDLALVREREGLVERFGTFHAGFDFSGPMKPLNRRYQPRPEINTWQNNVAPRFKHVDELTRYSEAQGYGWTDDGNRKGSTLSGPDYVVLSALQKAPKLPPPDVLYSDYITGEGPQSVRVNRDGERHQVFKLKANNGDYMVSFLHPDRRITTSRHTAHDGFLEIPFPLDRWQVSGLIVHAVGTELQRGPSRTSAKGPRPTFAHHDPGKAESGRDLTLELEVSPRLTVETVRLHYRTLDQTAPFRTLDSSANRARFVLPAAEIGAGWDLMYYFEILNADGTGWFYPDPAKGAPYFVVTIDSPGRGPGASEEAGDRPSSPIATGHGHELPPPGF